MLFRSQTIVRNGAPTGAEVDFISGTQELYAVTMLPPSPVAVIPLQLIDGDVEVETGAKVTLTPPSSLAPGSAFLSCQFKTLTTPLTTYSGTVASWPSPLKGVSPLQGRKAGRPN